MRRQSQAFGDDTTRRRQDRNEYETTLKGASLHTALAAWDQPTNANIRCDSCNPTANHLATNLLATRWGIRDGPGLGANLMENPTRRRQVTAHKQERECWQGNFLRPMCAMVCPREIMPTQVFLVNGFPKSTIAGYPTLPCSAGWLYNSCLPLPSNA